MLSTTTSLNMQITFTDYCFQVCHYNFDQQRPLTLVCSYHYVFGQVILHSNFKTQTTKIFSLISKMLWLSLHSNILQFFTPSWNWSWEFRVCICTSEVQPIMPILAGHSIQLVSHQLQRTKIIPERCSHIRLLQNT